jgi:iron only hydrogenase large subunit-like protein
LDVNFCKGGCIGGPYVSSNISLDQKKKRVLDYFKLSKEHKIPKINKGILRKAKGLKFTDIFLELI